jgi:hypothetical protein
MLRQQAESLPTPNRTLVTPNGNIANIERDGTLTPKWERTLSVRRVGAQHELVSTGYGWCSVTETRDITT